MDEQVTRLTAQVRVSGSTVRGYVQKPTKDTASVRELFPRFAPVYGGLAATSRGLGADLAPDVTTIPLAALRHAGGTKGEVRA